MSRRERLKVSGNPRQYDDLQPFITEQALLRRLAGESQLPVLEWISEQRRAGGDG